MKVDEDRGAYVGSTEHAGMYMMMYCKRTREELQAALPLSFDPNLRHANYQIALFDQEERDYIGHISFAHLEGYVIDNNMKNLFQKYETLKEYFPELEKDGHRAWIAFVQDQFNMIQ